MAGVDFDRQAFVPALERAPRPPARMLGLLLFLCVLAALVFLGYKLLSDSRQSAPAVVDSQSLETVQQQLAKIEKRLDQLERRRKSSTTESAAARNEAAKAAVEKASPKRTVYTIAPASGAQTRLPRTQQALRPSQTSSAAETPNDTKAADREAWQATTDRLADVVGVVGSQEGEIAEARQQLNALLAQTRRNAVPFELRRGASPQSVGPVSMVLKGSDPGSQRYTLCIYVDDKCVELRNRSVAEVVVFVPSGHAAPVELVATKILRNQIFGYLEVPTGKTTP